MLHGEHCIMAAQKLTKGRFVQIIIMLTLLIVAFFWRTMTYNEVRRVNCVGQTECNFDVNGSQFTAIIIGQMLSIRTTQMHWTIQDIDAIQKDVKYWQIPMEEHHSLVLQNKQTDQTYTVELLFK